MLLGLKSLAEPPRSPNSVHPIHKPRGRGSLFPPLFQIQNCTRVSVCLSVPLDPISLPDEQERGGRGGVPREGAPRRQVGEREGLDAPKGHGDEEREPDPLVGHELGQGVDEWVREAGEDGEACWVVDWLGGWLERVNCC